MKKFLFLSLFLTHITYTADTQIQLIHPATIANLEHFIFDTHVFDLSDQNVLCCKKCCAPTIALFFEKNPNIAGVFVDIHAHDLSTFTKIIDKAPNNFLSLYVYGNHFPDTEIADFVEVLKTKKELYELHFPELSLNCVTLIAFYNLYRTNKSIHALKSKFISFTRKKF